MSPQNSLPRPRIKPLSTRMQTGARRIQTDDTAKSAERRWDTVSILLHLAKQPFWDLGFQLAEDLIKKCMLWFLLLKITLKYFKNCSQVNCLGNMIYIFLWKLEITGSCSPNLHVSRNSITQSMVQGMGNKDNFYTLLKETFQQFILIEKLKRNVLRFATFY